MRPKAWRWLGLGAVGAAAIGVAVGSTSGQATVEKPVVTVYKSPT